MMQLSPQEHHKAYFA